MVSTPGNDGHRGQASGGQVGLGRFQQGVPVALAAVGGVDDQQAHIPAAVDLDAGDDADVRVAADVRRLVGREQGACDLVRRGRVGERTPAQVGDGIDVVGAEPVERGHWRRSRVDTIEPRSSIWFRARSRFSPGLVTRK